MAIKDHLPWNRSSEKVENKETGHTYTRIGRMTGSFQQCIPFEREIIDENKIDASYKNGVLQVKLPKSPKGAGKTRKIPIKSA